MIEVSYIRTHPAAIRPTRAYPGDAGWDLFIIQDTFVGAGAGIDVKTGIAIAMPEGHYGRIVGRSSAMRRRGILVIEGIIDSGFRGELFSYAYNPGKADVLLQEGEAIAQLIVSPIPSIDWVERVNLEPSERGTSGFGSSGN